MRLVRRYGALCATLAGTLCCVGSWAGAQERALTSEDYARAEQLLSWNAKKLVRNLDVEPHWIEKSERFWFKNETADGKEFLVVDAEKGTSEPAFDHTRLAEAISTAAGVAGTEKSYNAKKLPFDAFTFVRGSEAIEFSVEKDKWTCQVQSYTCAKSKPEAAASGAEVVSPDKQWAIFVKEHNLFLKAMGTKQEFRLTSDGKPYDEYAVLPIRIRRPFRRGSCKGRTSRLLRYGHRIRRR